MRTFNIPTYEKLLRENTRNNFYVKIDETLLVEKNQTPEPPLWEYIRKHRETGSIATSIDRLTYMNIANIEIDREMLFGFSSALNPNQRAKLYGARVYVEVQDETGSMVHPEGGKSIKALHPAGRTRMSWESLWNAIDTYGISVDLSNLAEPDFSVPIQSGTLIPECELQAFKEANGYNEEPEQF